MALEGKNASIETEEDTKKQTFNGEEAWRVIAAADKVYVASGKSIVEFQPDTADKEEMLKKITGRTGNLRAPALKKGNVFYIGYTAEMYDGL